MTEPLRGPRPRLHLFRRGQVEVGCVTYRRSGALRARFGADKPGYRWAPAWAQAVRLGVVSMPLTLAHWQRIAADQQTKLRLHPTQRAAMRAAAKEYR